MIIITAKDIAKKIAKENKIDQKFSQQFTEEVFRTIGHELKNGHSVTVWGLGRLKPVIRPEREYHTPAGKTGVCPAKTVVRWEMSEKFKDFLDGKIDDI